MPETDNWSDDALIVRLRSRDERAFAELVRRHHLTMVKVARAYVPSQAVAEEVAQETWLGVLGGIDRFEQRSSLRTWIFRILTNQARTRGQREKRSLPFSALEGDEGPVVDPDRFRGDLDRWPHHWTSSGAPTSWEQSPESRVLAREALRLVADIIGSLPPAQKAVITLRDVEGWAAQEVCESLTLSEANQRVLLHRARSKVRQGLETYASGNEQR